MIVKPLSLLLIFVLTIINFIILLLPFAVVFSPVLLLFEAMIREYWLNVLLFLVFCTSALMLLYLFFDMLFGLTVRRLSAGTVPCKKMTAVAEYQEIERAFLETQTRFKEPKVKLYIDPRMDVVNAFAVGSLMRNRIIITMGLIQRIHSQARSHQEYIDAIKGILGHEMSHLINKDFLPGLLLAANERANYHLSKIMYAVFASLAFTLRLIPFVGSTLSHMLILLYNGIHHSIYFFYSWVIMPIYRFIQKGLGRSIEYRCDRQSALAFSGSRMAAALSALGKGSYFSLFSTHPKTKSRIKKVQDVMPSGDIVRPNIVTQVANFISIAGLVAMCAFCGYIADMPNLNRQYFEMVHKPAMEKVLSIVEDVRGLGEMF